MYRFQPLIQDETAGFDGSLAADGMFIMLDDKAYSVLKLNLTSAAGAEGRQSGAQTKLKGHPTEHSLNSTEGSQELLSPAEPRLFENLQPKVAKDPISSPPEAKSEKTKAHNGIKRLKDLSIDSALNLSRQKSPAKQSLVKTKLATVEIRSDPFDPEDSKANAGQGSPTRPAMKKKSLAQPPKKKQPHLVSERSRQEKELKEMKQNKLKS